MNDKAKIDALRAALESTMNASMLTAAAAQKQAKEALALTADASEQAPEEFTDAMYLAWDGFDNSMSCEERAAIYFAVRAVDPAAPVADTGAVSVPRATLETIYDAMNHMGDQLNEMDVVEADDEKVFPAFYAIRELLGLNEEDVPLPAMGPTALASPPTADSAADARDAARRSRGAHND